MIWKQNYLFWIKYMNQPGHLSFWGSINAHFTVYTTTHSSILIIKKIKTNILIWIIIFFLKEPNNTV